MDFGIVAVMGERFAGRVRTYTRLVIAELTLVCSVEHRVDLKN